MSKIGKKNIEIPKDVKAAIAGNILNLEGPKGKRSIELKNDILISKLMTLKFWSDLKIKITKIVFYGAFKEV